MNKKLLLIFVACFVTITSCMAQGFPMGGFPTGGYFIGPIYCPPINYQALEQQCRMMQQQIANNAVENARQAQMMRDQIAAQAAYNVQHGITPMVIENSSSSSSNTSTSSSRSSSSKKTSHRCSACNGSGSIVRNDGSVATYGQSFKKKCPTCGYLYWNDTFHRHETCKVCHGKGYWE